MKRIALLLSLIVSLAGGKSYACGPSYEPDSEYYNLFMQDIIDAPQYYPFLLSLNSAFYNYGEGSQSNENILEWSSYFGISYSDARYLVFDASELDLQSMCHGVNVDAKLAFATPAFMKKYKEALEYLAYAKYLEPYMRITPSDNSWYYYTDSDAARASDLDYNRVTMQLQQYWKLSKDKDIKLRYGYQLVRFAHYNREYDDALSFFDTYVESLNYKPVMYYHALGHKAGAERGLGDILSANYNYFLVFSHSDNLKVMAVTSMRMSDLKAYQSFLNKAQTQNEKNDAYLLLGYLGFNDPLNEMVKITSSSPDAIQAKVLMARAVNTLERNMLSVDSYFYYGRYATEAYVGADKKYPIVPSKAVQAYFDKVYAFSKEMANSGSVKDKDFWYLTTAYLHFLNKDFSQAKSELAKVKSTNEKYVEQKKNLAMYIDVCEQPVINSEVENRLFATYKDVFTYNVHKEYEDSKDGFLRYNTYHFLTDILANRYYMQKEYGKAFLLHNNMEALKLNPNMELVGYIETFYHKKDKNAMEQHIMNNLPSDIQNELDHMRGILYLTDGKLDEALSSFKKQKAYVRPEISFAIFGYNRIECFECSEQFVMGVDYLSEFPYIKPAMNEVELTEALIKLKNAGAKNDKVSAKANYLLGNFFFNVTRHGYFRQLLRYDQTNGYCMKFDYMKEPPIYDGIYFKYYPMYYKNNISLASMYLEKAYKQDGERELKARIAFALSKCEQEDFYDMNNITFYRSDKNNDGILISNRKYFKELAKYNDTRFFKEVKSNCKYFDYYVATSM